MFLTKAIQDELLPDSPLKSEHQSCLSSILVMNFVPQNWSLLVYSFLDENQPLSP